MQFALREKPSCRKQLIELAEPTSKLEQSKESYALGTAAIAEWRSGQHRRSSYFQNREFKPAWLPAQDITL